MKRLHKHKSKIVNWIPACAGMTVLILGIAYFLLHAKSVEAAWFDTNWDYRQAVTVTVTSSASDITNLETLLTVNTSALISAKLQSSCQDLRFTSATGKLLPYYIDSGCNTTTTKIWVMADLVPKNTTTYIMYMYYGNPTAVAGTDATKFRLFNGLVGYWTMNETANSWAGTAGEVKDSSVNVNNGTGSGFSSNSPTASGQYGNAGSLSAGSSRYVDIPNSNALSPSAITISCWLNMSSVSGDIGIISKRVASANNDEYNILYRSTGDGGGDAGIPSFVFRAGGATATAYSSSFNTTGQWVHVAVTYAGGTTGKMYLNGVLSGGSSSGGTITHGTADLIIGALDNSPINKFFSGTIDDVRIYNRALSASEISQLYQNPGNIASNATGVALPSISFGSETQAPGPIAYWKFDDGTGTSAKDSSSNANTATLGGSTIPTWQTEDQCISGKCLYFDGASSKVTGSKIAKAIQTVAFWIRPNTIATQGLVNLDGGTHKISTNSSGVISATGFTSPTYYINGIAQTSPTLTLNQWNYVEITTGTSFDTTSSFTVGTDGTNFIKGFIDEVKFYQYARSAAQVQSDFNSRGSLVAGANILGSPSTSSGQLSQGLVGYWKMDESSWTNNCSTASVLDSSGNGNNGQACPNSTGPTGGATGKFGNAGSFDGADDYVTGSDSNLPSGSAARTTSLWFNLAALPSNGNSAILFAYGTAAVGQAYAVFVNQTGGVLNLGVSNSGSSVNKIFTPVVGTWYQLTITQAADGTVNIYINGALATTGSLTTSTVLNAYYIGRNVIIASFTQGLIDETRVYNRALSPEDVANLYNFAPGPVGYWNFEENTGSTVNDRSGNGNTGTWAGTLGSQWAAGKYGQAGNFNGSDNYVSTGQFNFTQQQSFTVSTWAKFPTTVGLGSVVDKGLGFNNTYGLIIGLSTRVATFGLRDTAQVSITGTTPLNDNRWHYLTGIRDKLAGKIYVYVDGNLEGTTTDTTSGDFNRSSNVDIGARGNDNAQEIAGQIDETRIYNYALSPKQVIQDMNASHPGVGGNQGTAVGQWKFEEGADNKCSGGTNDACNSGNGGNTLDLAQSGMSVPASGTSGWTNSGKFGKALVFDGSNDYLATSGNPTGLKITSNLTLNAWVNLVNTSSAHDIIAKDGASGNFGYRLYTDSSGKLNMEVSSDGTALTTVTGNKVLATGTWYHLVGVYIPSTSITLYVNGYQDKQTTSSIPSAIFLSTANLNIGGQNAGTNLMQGTIDEPKVYNYDLTQDDVKADYNRSSSEVLGALSNNSSYQPQATNQIYCVPGDATSCAGPVGEWNFDEGTGSSVTDSSGNGNTGTWSGTGNQHWLSGKYNKAGNFNGTDDYVSIPASTSIDSPTSFTIAFWIKAPTPAGNPFYIDEYNGSNNAEKFELLGAGTGMNMRIGDGSTFNTYFGVLTGILDNNWHYGSVTYDGATLKGYADGKQVFTQASAITPYTGAAPLQISGFSGAGGLVQAKFDQVRLSNYARTPAQVAWDYNRGLPVGWWKLDDCQGTIANDSSGNNNKGTITIGGSGSQSTTGTCPTLTGAWGNGNTGKINQSLNFDGNDDYVQTASNVLNPSSGDFSASVWFKAGALPTTSGIMELLTQLNGSGTSRDWLGMVNTAGVTTLYSNLGNTNTIGTKALATGTWYNATLTKSGTTLNLYLNGILDKTGTATVESATGASVMSVNKNLASNFYNGQLDDVRIYNYQLTQTQIQNIYNGGSAVRYGPLTGSP